MSEVLRACGDCKLWRGPHAGIGGAQAGGRAGGATRIPPHPSKSAPSLFFTYSPFSSASLKVRQAGSRLMWGSTIVTICKGGKAGAGRGE